MTVSKHQKYKTLMECSSCKKKQQFEFLGNVKKCLVCLEKTSYREEQRQRWNRNVSNPDLVPEVQTVYMREASASTINKFNEVMERFHKLSKAEYEVVQLLWEGKKTVEVATILQISDDTVRTLLNRARTKLK